MNSQNRWNEIKNIWKNFSTFYDLLRGSFLLTILLVFGGYLFAINILNDYTTNVFTEGLGVLGTAIILDRLYQRRSEWDLKEQLIFQMGSNESITAKAAARMLAHKGWLYDGSLQGAKLRDANLERANLKAAYLRDINLYKANLEKSNLERARLQNSSLILANLKDVNLRGANLQDAILMEANLDGATLSRANLKNANLRYANLNNVNLAYANLDGASLSGANLEGVQWKIEVISGKQYSTTLPDGTEWTEETDVKRFTEPEHPEFWSPDSPELRHSEVAYQPLPY